MIKGSDVILFIVVGFLAQLIDGALGMAYGVASSSVLISMGMPPAAVSASVHTAEVFTTGVSGLSHWKLGNVKPELLKKLLIPGVVGGVLGACALTAGPAGVIRPLVAVYLMAMGLVILARALGARAEREVTTALVPLGFAGGLLDAMGGGGWGPIVTSTLVARGNHVRFTVGTVNAAEFFVTLAQSVTFVLFLGTARWEISVGLIIGGMLAAPLAARMCRLVPGRLLMVIVGALITILGARAIYLALA